METKTGREYPLSYEQCKDEMLEDRAKFLAGDTRNTKIIVSIDWPSLREIVWRLIMFNACL